MKRRLGELDLTWREMATKSKIAKGTLMRYLESDDAARKMQPRTRARFERAFEWESGSVDTILDGGEPTLREPEQPEHEPVAVIVDPATGQIDPAQAVRRLLQLVPSIRENAGPERAREQFRLAWDIAVDTGVLNQVSDELAATQKAL